MDQNDRAKTEEKLMRGKPLQSRGLRGRHAPSGDGLGSSTPPPPEANTRKRGDVLRAPKRRHHFVLWIILLIVIVFGVWLAMFSSKVDANLHSFPVQEQQELDQVLAPSASWGTQPVNVLLLGSDARADDPGIGARTDTMVLARIDPATKIVSLVSLPRDVLIESDDYGTYKLNAAYTYEGADRAVTDVEELCGIKIDHVVVTDFVGLADLVDAIGGIDVYLDEGIDNPKAGTATLEAGQQHINGAQALVMARDRDYVDGDYTRQSSQRKVLSGIVKRILTMAPWEMPGAIEGCSKCLATDSSTNTLGLILLAVRLKVPWAGMQLRTSVLPSQPADIGGVSYVIADKAGVRELMARLENGGNVEDPVVASSIDQDIAQARGW